jgi:hypothetical protein
LQHLGFKDRLARGADFGHFTIIVGLFFGKAFFLREPKPPLVTFLIIRTFFNVGFTSDMFIKSEKKFVNAILEEIGTKLKIFYNAKIFFRYFCEVIFLYRGGVFWYIL